MVGPLEPHFEGQGAKLYNIWRRVNESLESQLPTLYISSESVEPWPEHDPKFTRLYDLLPTGSSLWRHFRSKCKDSRRLPCSKSEVASSSSFRDIQKNHFVTAAEVWWRRTSTIVLSENALAFRLKIVGIQNNKIERHRDRRPPQKTREN